MPFALPAPEVGPHVPHQHTERSPQGRPAGSLAWAGLANSFYSIDPVNRLCGVWATQLLPFFHPTAIEGFRAFETAVHDALG